MTHAEGAGDKIATKLEKLNPGFRGKLEGVLKKSESKSEREMNVVPGGGFVIWRVGLPWRLWPDLPAAIARRQDQPVGLVVGFADRFRGGGKACGGSRGLREVRSPVFFETTCGTTQDNHCAPGVTGAIVGARSQSQVDGWLPAAALELTDDDLDEIVAAIERTGAGSGSARPPRSPRQSVE